LQQEIMVSAEWLDAWLANEPQERHGRKQKMDSITALSF
jgi:hypothetical protein